MRTLGLLVLVAGCHTTAPLEVEDMGAGKDLRSGGGDMAQSGLDVGGTLPDLAMAAPSCSDQLKNQQETDVDCGGPCPACGVGKTCAMGSDCGTGFCKGGICAVPACNDGVKNGNETDQDCGGMCPPCGSGKACDSGQDCGSQVCTNKMCKDPTCADQTKNGNESDVDCGGSCPKCPDGKTCGGAPDCASGACKMGVCVSASCSDNLKNGNESDVDCGGSCPSCVVGKVCGKGADCGSGVCSAGKCAAPTCGDLVKNGNETDVDCGGGGMCQPCGPGKGCIAASDCTGSLTCNANVCATPTSCKALKVGKPMTADGVYTLDPDGNGMIAPFQAWCDMTNDGGGWMLVTAALIDHEAGVSQTVMRSADGRGGLILQVWANAAGCGMPGSQHQVYFADTVPWTQVRYDQQFNGANSCWGIFGNETYGTTVNLVPFDTNLDTIRNQVKMGGSNGDAFDGATSRCDNIASNFWHSLNGGGTRSAQVVLRRGGMGLAGLGTGVSCTVNGAGMGSPTYWIYSNIYVR